MKKMLAVLVVALASLSFAGTPNTKTYKINLSYPSKVGINQLAPGEYKLAVDTAAVRMVELKTGKAIEIAAKVETAEDKFENTAITTEMVDGVAEIREIRLGGSNIHIDFRSTLPIP